MKDCYNNPNLTDRGKTRDDLFTENLQLVRELSKTKALTAALISVIILIVFLLFCFLVFTIPSGPDKLNKNVSINATK